MKMHVCINGWNGGSFDLESVHTFFYGESIRKIVSIETTIICVFYILISVKTF